MHFYLCWALQVYIETQSPTNRIQLQMFWQLKTIYYVYNMKRDVWILRINVYKYKWFANILTRSATEAWSFISLGPSFVISRAKFRLVRPIWPWGGAWVTLVVLWQSTNTLSPSTKLYLNFFFKEVNRPPCQGLEMKN